jgi:tripartite-type tricarboxylate transporter receptor subunit TctC
MKFPRRNFLELVAGAAAVPAFGGVASAQAYPSRPVRIVVGVTPGGGLDISARLTGHWLSERLGQQFIIENRPGAGTNIAAEAVVRATADGYTLLFATAANAINATLYDKLNFNFLRDLAPVASFARAPLVMVVNPSFPAKTVPEFIAYAKANPGKVSMGSSGNGTPQHMGGELFKMLAAVNLVHVPYRGGAPALADLIGGQVQVVFADLSAIEYVRAGTLRALAVTTATRWDTLPDLPAIGEFVPGYELKGWLGVVAPRNTPAAIVDTLNREINAGLADAGMKARLADLGYAPFPSSPAEFGRFLAGDTENWSKVIKFAGIKAE